MKSDNIEIINKFVLGVGLFFYSLGISTISVR
jgi:hypothetical protein